jgi:hypothetical protein
MRMPSILDHCCGIGRERLAPGTVLFAEGQNAGRLYILIEGQLDLSIGGVRIASIKEPSSMWVGRAPY